MLEVDNITVKYGDLVAINDVSFRVDEGERVAILGPSGAGKTTTLKAISGLLPISNGTIKYDSVSLNKVAAHKITEMGIAHVPEGRGIFTTMTVLENLEVGAHTREARKYKEESLQMVYDLFPRLKERQKQIAGTLSGGERQMLAVGRGLMLRPKLLMLDEPSLGLAPLLVSEMFKLVQTIHEREGISILLVEQNVYKALDICDRGYVLESGSIALKGDKDFLLKHERIKKSYLGL